MPESRGAVDYVERTGGVHVELPTHPSGLGVARMLVHTLAQRRDLDDERVEDLVLAVSEACTAVVEAGGDVVLRWREEPDQCVVEVTSEGAGAELPQPAPLPSDPGAAAMEGQLRVPLIQALVDDVQSDGSSLLLTVQCGSWEDIED